MRKYVDVVGLGRDSGRVYRVTEMPALKGELWAIKVLKGLQSQGLDIPDFTKTPSAKLAEIGIIAIMGLPTDDMEAALSEMMSCVTVVIPDGTARAKIADDFEEWATILKLREEVVKLQLSFFLEK